MICNIKSARLRKSWGLHRRRSGTMNDWAWLFLLKIRKQIIAIIQVSKSISCYIFSGFPIWESHYPISVKIFFAAMYKRIGKWYSRNAMTMYRRFSDCSKSWWTWITISAYWKWQPIVYTTVFISRDPEFSSSHRRTVWISKRTRTTPSSLICFKKMRICFSNVRS